MANLYFNLNFLNINTYDYPHVAGPTSIFFVCVFVFLTIKVKLGVEQFFCCRFLLLNIWRGLLKVAKSNQIWYRNDLQLKNRLREKQKNQPIIMSFGNLCIYLFLLSNVYFFCLVVFNFIQLFCFKFHQVFVPKGHILNHFLMAAFTALLFPISSHTGLFLHGYLLKLLEKTACFIRKHISPIFVKMESWDYCWPFISPFL